MRVSKSTQLLSSLILLAAILLSGCKKSSDNNSTTSQLTLKDIDGNVYKTITIGSQVWMSENLRTTRFNDGTPIPLVIPDYDWVYRTTPAFCWHNDDSTAFKIPYGALYNWHAVNSGKLAPNGWHVPSDAEWQILINSLGGELVAGGKMKETDTTHWESPNTSATNSIGFTGLPGGMREMGYTGFGELGIWWSNTPYDSTFAYGRTLYNMSAWVSRNLLEKDFGLSVRCLKN